MEMSSWLSEMLDNVDDAFGEDYFSENFSPFPTFNPSPLELEATETHFERPTKQLKSSSRSSYSIEQVSSPEDSSSHNMLSFGNSVEKVGYPANKNFVSDRRVSQGDTINKNYAPKASPGNKRAFAPSTKPSTFAQDHIMAERKRREKLSQGFIALSAIVPGLKKMDKTSVLEASIRYIKELQERAKTLEDQTAKSTMESVFCVKKYQISSDDDSSGDETSRNSSSEVLPEIQTRISDENVLIHIHCEKQKGAMVKALEEIENLNLSIVSCSSIPIGSLTLDITISAKMGEGFNMEVKDLVKKLQSSFRRSL